MWEAQEVCAHGLKRLEHARDQNYWQLYANRLLLLNYITDCRGYDTCISDTEGDVVREKQSRRLSVEDVYREHVIWGKVCHVQH